MEGISQAPGMFSRLLIIDISYGVDPRVRYA